MLVVDDNMLIIFTCRNFYWILVCYTRVFSFLIQFFSLVQAYIHWCLLLIVLLPILNLLRLLAMLELFDLLDISPLLLDLLILFDMTVLLPHLKHDLLLIQQLLEEIKFLHWQHNVLLLYPIKKQILQRRISCSRKSLFF